MDETEIHEMQGYQEGIVTVFYCPVCYRQMQFIGNELFVVYVGNPHASHRGAVGGISIGAVLAEPEPSPFEQWAEEVDLPTALDSE